jgi:hypothetical protein
MQVKIVPVSGCLQVFLGFMTLGVAPLMAWVNERSWPSLVDEQGLVTRGGTRIAWNEFTRVTKVFTKVGSTRTEHFELASPKGKVVVAAYRLVSGENILNYIWQRLPERAKQAQA